MVDVKYDWTFWYYLSWIKKRANEEGYGRFTDDFTDDNMKKSFASDMAGAREAGYHDGMKSTFPLPGGQYDLVTERKKDLEKAYGYFEKNDYLEAENVILDALLKEGVENYIKAAYYCLLGQIGAALNDKKQIEYGRRRNTRTTTYPLLICKHAREYIDDPNDELNLKNWQPTIHEFLEDYELDITATYPKGGKDVEPLRIEKSEKTERKVNFYSDVIFSFEPRDVASTLQWKYSLDSPKYFMNIEKEPMIKVIGRPVTSKKPFGDSVKLYGGGEYSFKFSTKKSMVKYYGLSALAGFLAYVWMS